jgi:hypothetical protein
MRVKLDVSPDAEIKVETDEGGNVLSVEFEPFFAKKSGQAVLAYGAVVNDNGVRLDRFSLVVSGATGKVTKTGRAEPVKAAADAITDDDEKTPKPKTQPPAPKPAPPN